MSVKNAGFLFLSLVFLTICACENPWMAEILEPKTITFNSNGGSQVPSQNLYKGQKVKRPSNPTRNDDTFLGWFEDNETFNKEWNFETIPTKDLTLYAKWYGTDDKAIERFKQELNGLTANSVPYTVLLNVSKLTQEIRDALMALPADVTVILDLSGSTMTEIPENAFFKFNSSDDSTGCASLARIILPDSVTSIGNSAFHSCTSLTEINIPDGITVIEGWTFYGTALTSVTIPVSVQSIGMSAFNACYSLTSVTFQGGIPKDGFYSGSDSDNYPVFMGNLRDVFYSSSAGNENGTPGTYTKTNQGNWIKD
jgi:uncharacterized repeat protein (TIGR02543 family)